MHKISLTLIGACAVLATTSHVASAQAAGPEGITLRAAQFSAFRWLDGAWRGSGGNYPAFYEDFRFVDDSTVQRHSFTDSTMTKTTESSRIEFRGGRVYQVRGDQRTAVLVLGTGDSLRFASLSGRGGTLYVRRTNDHWSAILGPPDRPGVTYEMKRIP